VIKQNISATKFEVTVFEIRRRASLRHVDAAIHEHRGYTEIAAMIEKSGLSQRVKERTLRVFRRIGEAEAKFTGRAGEDSLS